MINREKFIERYSDFDKDIVLDILDMFIAKYEDWISKLSTDLIEQNPGNLKKDAHAFKGIMANIEADCMAFEQIEEMEEISNNLLNARDNDKELPEELVKNKFDEMANYFAKFKTSSAQLLSEAKDLRSAYLA